VSSELIHFDFMSNQQLSIWTSSQC